MEEPFSSQDQIKETWIYTVAHMVPFNPCQTHCFKQGIGTTLVKWFNRHLNIYRTDFDSPSFDPNAECYKAHSNLAQNVLP